MSRRVSINRLPNFAIVGISLTSLSLAQTDPGVRSGPSAAGAAISGLTVKEGKFFSDGLNRFNQVASVSGTIPGTDPGLGPRFNLDSCAGCHHAPAIGGSSPATNPQVTVAPQSQVNPLISMNIISANGPVREVRFVSDGGVHDLFTIMGRSDTPPACNISQPNFSAAMANGGIHFRVPTPLFGAGLIEAIPDENIAVNEGVSKNYGVQGRANRNGNDGTISRFGWKAQNKSLAVFAGEAYNVEQGISNDLFPDERGEGGKQDPAVCRVVASPNDHTNYEQTQPQAIPSDSIAFANFMRFLAPPSPVTSYGAVAAASIQNGSIQFSNVGCAICHIPSMKTGNHSSAALANQTANLYSDLLVHHMGTLLNDGISQGSAGPDEFRTAPLWGLGQRIFFLHDGRTSDLLVAIQDHLSSGSEASTVINNFNNSTYKQDILNFLRSL